MDSVEASITGLLAGIFLNTYLFGLVAHQFAIYVWSKFNDPPITRYMVLFLFALDTSSSVAIMYTTLMYRDNLAILPVTWTNKFNPMNNTLSAFVTHLFLSVKIRVLTKSKVLCCVVVLMAILSFVLGMTFSFWLWVAGVSDELPHLSKVMIAWLVVQVIVDVFITIILTITFSRLRGGIRRTDAIINRLVRGAIQTGLFSGIFSIILIICNVFPNPAFSVFFIPIGRVYTNTLMDHLNVREWARERMAASDTSSFRTRPASASVSPVHNMQSSPSADDRAQVQENTEESREGDMGRL